MTAGDELPTFDAEEVPRRERARVPWRLIGTVLTQSTVPIKSALRNSLSIHELGRAV